MNVFALGRSETKGSEKIIKLMTKNMALWNEQADQFGDDDVASEQ